VTWMVPVYQERNISICTTFIAQLAKKDKPTENREERQ